MPIWRNDPAAVKKVTGSVGHSHRDGSSQGHVRFFTQETLSRQMDGNHRSRAGGLNRNAGPFQIELVRNARAQKILVVPNERGDVILGEPAIQSDVHEVGVHGGTGKNADASLIAIPVAARVFERLISQFQQNAMLWVDEFRFHRRKTEKTCIKVADVFKDGRGLHIVRIIQARPWNAGFEKILVRKPRDRLDASR